MLKRVITILLLVFASLTIYAKIIPIAPQAPDTLRIHGHTLVDNWAWMKDREHPSLGKHLKKESAYLNKSMMPSRKLAKQLFREFASSSPKTSESYPYLEKGYYYYNVSYDKKPYSLMYRKKGSLDSEPELILDPNKLAKGHKFFSIGSVSISPNQRYVAYTVDYSGDEYYALFFKDMATGKTTSTSIQGVSNFSWYADNFHFLVITQNERWQGNRCLRGSLGNSSTTLLYLEEDPEYELSLYESSDESRIFLLSYNKSRTECYDVPANNPDSEMQLITSRDQDITFYPDYFDGFYYIQANYTCADGSIFQCEPGNTEPSYWVEIIAGKIGEPISSYILFDKKIVLIRRYRGENILEIYARDSGDFEECYFPEIYSSIGFWHNPDPHASAFTYTLENELMPYTIFSYDFITQETRELHQYPAEKPVNFAEYQIEQHRVELDNDISIPLRIMYKKGIDLHSPNPLWLYGYGAYGDCEDPYFSETMFPILDRGVIYAVAHVRGGGEQGDYWYQQGKLQNKQNSFSDFIACMDYLLDSCITEPSKLIIEGGSAGGLLVGAVANIAPEKCKLVIADVPFVDVINSMLDDSLPLTTQEYEEWGNPSNREYFEYMLSYSPYDNVSAKAYPTMLISAGWMDTRVGYWEALKWAQKLRTNTISANPILFRLSMHEGHTGSTNRFQSLKTYAQTVAFALSLVLD